MSSMAQNGTQRRMSSDERRAEILLAAHAVFGARGYEGATTDEVARAAGVRHIMLMKWPCPTGLPLPYGL